MKLLQKVLEKTYIIKNKFENNTYNKIKQRRINKEKLYKSTDKTENNLK